MKQKAVYLEAEDDVVKLNKLLEKGWLIVSDHKLCGGWLFVVEYLEEGDGPLEDNYNISEWEKN